MKKLVIIASAAVIALTAQNAAFSDTSRDEYLKINDQLVAKKQQVSDLQKRIKDSQAQISALQNAESSLENQIAILENQIAKNALDIEETQAQIEETNLELQQINADIADAEVRIASDRGMLGRLIAKIDREDERGTLLTMFLADNLSGIFERAKSLKELQGDLLGTVERLQETKAGLDQKHLEATAKNNELRKQKDQLAVDQIKLAESRDGKQALMDATQMSESKYRNLMSSLQDEAGSVADDIASLEAQAAKKLAGNDRFPTGTVILSWPVPSHTVSTPFHDPDYLFRRIMEHPGMDIAKTPQGTPVHAAAPGYVLKVKDAGYGYSYIIVLHAGGVSTVYGHLSRLSVREDSFVDRGDIIGYSGGMPGTRGAGNMTTGPHLHFETRVNGIPTDPMDYLVD